MDANRKKKLEKCVLQILKHGDMDRMTESKVRKLAAEEMGFEVTDPAFRRTVKQVVEEFFTKAATDAEQDEEEANAEPLQERAKPERRRNAIRVEEDEEAEMQPKSRSSQPPSKRDRDVDASDEENGEEEEDIKVQRRKPTIQASGKGGKKPNAAAVKRSVIGDEDSEEENKNSGASRITKQKERPALSEDEECADEEEDLERRKGAGKTRPLHTSATHEKKRYVASTEEEEEEGEPAKRKMPMPLKSEKRRNVSQRDEDEDDEDTEETRAKKRPKTDVDDSVVLQLSKKRNVAVQEFKGRLLVSIRDYYEKEGKMLPTSKGISLTIDQWEAFKEGVPDIEAAIKRFKR